MEKASKSAFVVSHLLLLLLLFQLLPLLKQRLLM